MIGTVRSVRVVDSDVVSEYHQPQHRARAVKRSDLRHVDLELSSSSPLDEEEEHRLLFNSRGWDLLDSRSGEPFQRRDSDSEHMK